MSSFDTVKYNEGDIIIKEGTPGDRAFVINKGHVEVKKLALDGNQVVIARLGPGQIFGEMCLFDNSPRSASVLALSNVELSIIEKEQFLHYLKDTPPQIKVIVELLLKRLRQTSNLVTLLKLEKKDLLKASSFLQDNINNLDFPT